MLINLFTYSNTNFDRSQFKSFKSHPLLFVDTVIILLQIEIEEGLTVKIKNLVLDFLLKDVPAELSDIGPVSIAGLNLLL